MSQNTLSWKFVPILSFGCEFERVCTISFANFCTICLNPTEGLGVDLKNLMNRMNKTVLFPNNIGLHISVRPLV